MDLDDDGPGTDTDHFAAEYSDFLMMQAMMEMFERHSAVQRILRIGYLDDADEGFWSSRQADLPWFPVNINRRLNGNQGKSSHHIYLPVSQSPASLKSPSHFSPEVKEIVEGHTEPKTKKHMRKADRKRLKKSKRKERKRLQELEKEKNNSQDKVEGRDYSKQSNTEENEGVTDKSTEEMKVSSGKQDADSSSSSSEEVSSDEEDCDPDSISGSFEGLDLTSTFVSKAADIAKRKFKQKPKQEKREKKIANFMKDVQAAKKKTNEENDDINKNTAALGNPGLEENLKISIELAELGKKHAQAGQFVTAVKHYTDAIKHNPTDFRLFGNRSYCFEKMQEYKKALTDAELALSMFPSWVKGHYRKGRALAGLKRYEEAANAFKDVLRLNSTCADAAQELMRVQISQLMEYGFSREQSSNALIIHGTVNKALEVLFKLNSRPETTFGNSAQFHKNLPQTLAETTSRTSVAPSANFKPPSPPPAQDPPKHSLRSRSLGPVQNTSNVRSKPRPLHRSLEDADTHQQQLELFPVWVGNVVPTVKESTIFNLFCSVGQIYSIKLLINRRCAFVNFTKKDHCDDAIRRFHGYVLMGTNIVVRYPDRIPKGMGISRMAIRAEGQQRDCFEQDECVYGRSGGCNRRPGSAYRLLGQAPP